MAAEVVIHVFRPDGWRSDVFLETTIWYQAVDGRHRWKSFSTAFDLFEKAEDQIANALRCQTDFVKENWIRIEVSVPNRNQYGNLCPGWIQDTGVLLATRSVEI